MVEFYGTLAGDIYIYIYTQSSHGSVIGNEACFCRGASILDDMEVELSNCDCFPASISEGGS